MGKHQEERKIPVIMVKKRRTFSEPSLSEKTDIIAPVFTEQTTESVSAGINSSAVEKHIPEAPASNPGADRQSDRHLKTTPDPTKIGGVAERGLL